VTRTGGHLGLEAVSMGAATASKERKCTSGHNPPEVVPTLQSDQEHDVCQPWTGTP
jgi:hypothetical protein